MPSPAVTARRLYTPKTFSVQGPRRTVELLEREWQLLSLLFEYRGTFITRETIISRVWGPYYINQTKPFVDTLASLRAAMRQAGYPAGLIHEERDIGFGIRGGSTG